MPINFRKSLCRRPCHTNRLFADAVRVKYEEFVVGPPESGAPFFPIQAGIDAAVAAAGGERTIANPAVVKVLAGDYPDQVVRLHKFVHVWGAGTKDVAISSVVSGYVVVDLAPDPLAFVEWRGMAVNAPLGAPAAIQFTGNNPQALGLQDDILLGSAPGLVMDNTSPVRSAVEAVLVQISPDAPPFPAIDQDSGFLQVEFSDLENVTLFGGASPVVLRMGPHSAHARPLFTFVQYCTIVGQIVLDGRLSTSTAQDAITADLFYCRQFTTVDGTPDNPVLTTGAVAPGVVELALGYQLVAPSKWFAGFPAVQGTAGFSPVKVLNAEVSGKGITNGVPFSALCDGTYAVSDPIPQVV